MNIRYIPFVFDLLSTDLFGVSRLLASSNTGFKQSNNKLKK